MAETIVADFANGLLGKLVSLAAEQVIQAWNLDQDLDTLRQRLESVGALLYDAHSKNLIMSAAKDWFNKLEDVANVANVFMDQLAYQVTGSKVETRHRKALDFFLPSKNTCLYRFKVAHKIKSLQASFDQIFKSATDLGLQPVAYLGSIMQTRDIRSTSPYQDKALIVGRDKDVAHLVRMVCENHQEDLRVVAVKGMGGQGKTTLARMVLKSDDVIKMFPETSHLWITVSDDFDQIKILNEMVQLLTKTNSGLGNVQALVNKLQDHLKGKRFILVLDDVWNKEHLKWEDLRSSLLAIGGDKGSCILVTTREQDVIDAMQRCDCYSVDNLSEEDSYELFKKIAFSDGGVLETQTFAALGRSMVERCGGLPLAIKALGGLLYSKSEQEWIAIKNSETWKSKNVLPSLKLSYDNLPFLSLKQCFAYCSIMPKDTVINKDKLIQIWMALGFLLPPTGGNAHMEDIGNTYFNMLLRNSLLQDEERDAFGNIKRCKMHDLVHDLALDLSIHHSLILNASQEVNHVRKAIYVRVDQGDTDIKPTIPKRNFERVQMLHAGAYILRDALPYLTHLTILVLETDGKAAKELPSSLRKLKYLKYLDISCFDSRLPTYITELYNLQTLRIGKIDELPNKFCNLISLRHLYIKERYGGKRCVFNWTERLTSLQTLPHFVVSKDQKSLVGQLGGLKNLRGQLRLFGLNEVENIEEARKAKLCEKSNIQHLLLNWRDKEGEREKCEVSGYNDEDVMEGLEPHPNLQGLEIIDFMGNEFAKWMTMMTNLVNITLRNCNRCEVLPPLGHLPKLMKMDIWGMKNVKVIGRELSGGVDSGSSKVVTTTTTTILYPSLTQLRLERMAELEEWVEGVMSKGGYDGHTVFPKLEKLYIWQCPRLRKIPISCFPSLKELKIDGMESSMILESMTTNVTSLTSLLLWNMGDLSSSSTCSSSGSCSNIDSRINLLLKNNSPSLTELHLIEVTGLKRLTLGVSLVTLSVYHCPQLISINNLGQGSSLALKDLTMKGIPSSQVEGVFAHIQTSTLVELRLGPFNSNDELDEEEFPWPFSSSSSLSNSFPNLVWLVLYGWEKVKSITLFDQLHLSPIFSALTRLDLRYFEGVKALPDSIANLPSLKKFHITNCENLESLPMFDQSHCLEYLEITGCPIVKERYSKGSGPEWFKIQHIPRIDIH